MAQPTTLPFNQAIYNAGLQSPKYMEMVFGQDYGYNVLTQISAMLGPSKSIPTPRIEVPSLGNLSISSLVTAAPSASGTDLLVTVADSTGFRIGDVVLDKFLVKGRVTAKNGNVLTLSEYGTTFDTNLHFLIGHNAKVGWDSSFNRNSTGKSGLNYLPNIDFAYTGVTRESNNQSRRDRQKSDVMWKGNYWHTSWMDTTMLRYSKNLEMKYAFSERGVINPGTDQEIYSTEGLHEAILRQGQEYSLTSEMTLSDFNDILQTVARKSTSRGRKIALLMGSKALGDLQILVGNQYITYTGTQNTFGGASVQGLDIYRYNFLGLSVDFVRWDLLDDPMWESEISTITGAPLRSSSMYFLDLSPIPAADGSGMINPIQRYHLNNDELILGFTPGMVGLEDSTPSQVKEAIAFGQASLVTSDIDSTSFHVLGDCGLYVRAEQCAVVQLSS